MTKPVEPIPGRNIPWQLAQAPDKLAELAEHIQEHVPFPFSGVIAFEAGDGPIVGACHAPSPNPTTFDETQVFNVLSVGKMFTAIAVMQLIEEGKFTLKTPLSALLKPEEIDLDLKPPYLPQKPTKGSLRNLMKHMDKVTIGHLLSHTAGFVHRSASASWAEGESWVSSEMGKYAYSNYGYQLLATIIGKHSSEGNFQNHIEKRIFTPANMTRAIHELHYPSSSRLENFEVRAKGETKKDTSIEPYPHGNGCWRMPAVDLMEFGKALRNHQLIRGQTFDEMLNHKPPLCFMVDRHPTTEAIVGYGHPGGYIGESSFLWTWATNPPITAAVVSNFSGCQMVKPELDSLFVK